MKQRSNELRVTSRTRSAKLGGAIIKTIRDGLNPRIVAIGWGAVAVTMKGLIYARAYAASYNLDLSFKSAFVPRLIDGQEFTAVEVVVYVDDSHKHLQPVKPIANRKPS